MRNVKNVLILVLLATLSGCDGCSGDEQLTTAEQESENSAPVKEEPTETLKIEDQVVGKGEEAIAGKLVSVFYTGRLVDGAQFDSNVGTGNALRFELGAGRVIQGWEQGLVGMKVGGKRKLVIPPALAYGERGFGNVIPPQSTLVFDVELVKVETP